jgi:hypothetical protein
MSSNRLTYDACAYQKSLEMSGSPLEYALYSGKYENSAKCRIEFGVVGGNAVSVYGGNLVDLESELRGQTRQASICQSTMYKPSSKTCNNVSNGMPCSDVKLNHQPSCQIQYYPKTPTLPMPNKIASCNYK